MPLLTNQDPEIHQLIEKERLRQEDEIELIASENYTSLAIMEAQGTCLTNKYAEGYPKARYYGGCEHVDGIESIAIDRAKQLFDVAYANVQPHSGSQANTAAYMSLTNAGSTILGMALSDGGHLTHGSSVSFSGKVYNAVQYGINDDGLLDYNQIRDLAKKHNPSVIVGGFSAYSRKIDWSIYRDIADECGAKLLIDMAHVSGLVAADLYPNPIPYADVITSTTHKTLRGPRGGFILVKEDDKELHKSLNRAVFPANQGGPLMHVIAAKALCFKEANTDSFKAYQQQVIDNARAMASTFMERGYDVISGGTDNHLFLISLIKNKITGKNACQWLEEANITVNKNAVPNDPESPFVTSGLRIGTPAITTRGLKTEASTQLANWMCDILDNPSESVILKIKSHIADLSKTYPVYP